MNTTAPFNFEPAPFIPFRDKEAIARARAIRREDITRHDNPDYRIRVLPDAEIFPNRIEDTVTRIRESADSGQPFVMIMPNPAPGYARIAERLNAEKISCRHIHTFIMDEYADQDGNIAPETWEFGFGHCFKKFFIANIDPALRPPEKQVNIMTNANIGDYSKMIADLGGADIIYIGPGWTGHMAFIEPDAPEFAASSLEEWKSFGTRICTLSPLTIAQNSLHGCFGSSGDLTAVPPKATTIGPADVLTAKHRIANHAISVGASKTHSWQRLITRLCLHGPVTPLVPESVLQTTRTDVFVSESSAANIETRWDWGY